VRLFALAGASPLRVATGGNANWGSKFVAAARPASTNRRRKFGLGLMARTSPLGGAPKESQTEGKTLTPVGHPFITPSERRFAPKTVRQDWNGVRYELEQVSAFIGIRTLCSIRAKVCAGV
jgi:hypothetical protein